MGGGSRTLSAVPASLAAILAIVVALAACGPADPRPRPSPPPVPAGLDPGHVLVVAEELGGPTFIMNTFDPRSVTLYADGTVIASNPARNLMLATVSTRLGPESLGEAWAKVVGGGLAVDRTLRLPGVFDAGTTQLTVDDGMSVTRLAIDAIGMDPIDGEPTPRPDEAALRANAREAIGMLRELAGLQAYTPPALLLWWGRYEEAPSGIRPKLAAWTAPVDLSTAGVPTPANPIYERCLRLDGADASAVGAVAGTLAPDMIVEQAGARYAVAVRPIYPDEGARVRCPGS
jgi:hypothetical protein